MKAYVITARVALKVGVSTRRIERTLRKLGASKSQAKRAIWEARHA